MKLTRPAAALALACALASAVVTVTAMAAAAITGGERDGGRNPNVALISFYEDGRSQRCSASLVSPTVLLTAAHCTAGVDGRVLVTFDSVVAETPPPPVPVAADPASGYTAAELAAAGFLSGSAATHPAYSGFTDTRSWNDVGVVVLDRPAVGIAPARLAPSGYLDRFAPKTLNKTVFEAVGYGTEVRKPESGPQRPTPMDFPVVRRFAFVAGQKLTPQILQVNGNEKDPRGTGGTCFGDSGGPAFHGGYQVSVTSYTLTDTCRYIAGLQRVDIPVVQDWLAGFGVVPGP
jgi:hypothetical protein